MPHRPGHRSLSMTFVALAAMFVATTGIAQADTEPALVPAGAEATPSGPLAAEMAQQLELRPGGVQVSDNAMAWENGDAIMVWPSPGETAAPAGLGSNIRADLVQQLGLTQLVGPRSASGEVSQLGSPSTCPSGYYCFYTGANFDGSRLQFSSTCSGTAGSWGFDNTTSSWANRSSNKVVYAYDYRGGPYLWTMNRGGAHSYVGSADNNRMSYWKCRFA